MRNSSFKAEGPERETNLFSRLQMPKQNLFTSRLRAYEPPPQTHFRTFPLLPKRVHAYSSSLAAGHHIHSPVPASPSQAGPPFSAASGTAPSHALPQSPLHGLLSHAPPSVTASLTFSTAGPTPGASPVLSFYPVDNSLK